MAVLFKRDTSITFTDFDVDQPANFEDTEYSDFHLGLAPLLPTPHIWSATQEKQKSTGIWDIVPLRVFNFCSRRFKDFLEAWEPGIHFFRPMELKRKNGEPIGEYYGWTAGQDIDCLFTQGLDRFWRPERRNFNFGEMQTQAWYQNKYPDKGDGTVIRISKPAVAGHHLWMGGLLCEEGRDERYFMSDEMYRAYKKEKFRGLEFVAPVEEVDQPWVAEENMGIMLDQWREREANILKHWPESPNRHGVEV